MRNTTFVIAVQEKQFIAWLRAGLARCNELVGDCYQEDRSHPRFLCELPGKYGAAVRRDPACFILIDDLVSVSAETPELTREWQIRLSNLGESWLPFHFNAALVEQSHAQSTSAQVSLDEPAAPHVATVPEQDEQLEAGLLRPESGATLHGTFAAPAKESVSLVEPATREGVGGAPPSPTAETKRKSTPKKDKLATAVTGKNTKSHDSRQQLPLEEPTDGTPA